MGEVCPACSQEIKQAHKEHISKHKLTMIQMAAKHVMSTGVNDFKKRDVPGMKENSAYGNFQKLRYHGLIANVKVNGVKFRDRWLITRNSWSFLRGDIKLHKYVIVKNNHIEAWSEEKIHVKDVYYGSEVIHTTFEYFDSDGKMVGVRPYNGSLIPQQKTLL